MSKEPQHSEASNQGSRGYKKVFVKTYGCQMNEYDSEKMLMQLSRTHTRVESPEEADLVLVNTCSVRDKAEQKLYDLLGRLRKMKKSRPEMLIGVGGCVAQQEGEQIVKRNSAVDFVLGTHNISLLPSLVGLATEGNSHQVAVDYRDEWEELPDEFDAMPPEEGIIRSAFNSPVRALVAIQRGCNKNCAFCIVPRTRGPQVSRSFDEILKEVHRKVKMGAREVLLLGQTVNSYGLDLTPRRRFGELVREISEIDGVERIRFTSPHPAEFKKEFFDMFSSVPNLCPQIHLPLQSGSDRILKAMNRNYRRDRFLQIVSDLRERCPHIAISTDIIVGFPTETEEDFLQTMEIVEEVKFHMAFSFKYSPRPGTVSSEVYSEKEQVPEMDKQNRLERLQSRQSDITLAFNQTFLGQDAEILIETSKENGYSARGRSEYNLSAEVVVEQGEGTSRSSLSAGDIVKAKVVRASPHGIKCLVE